MLTVEEARERVIREIYALYDEDISVVDDLILAVQAAMPCYGGFEEQNTGRDCTQQQTFEANTWEQRPEPWFCPSCTARRKLAETQVSGDVSSP